jgi:hypothetical protein
MWGCEQLADPESVARCAKGRVFTAVDLAFAVRPALPQVEAILRDFAVRGLVEPVLQTLACDSGAALAFAELALVAPEPETRPHQAWRAVKDQAHQR